MYLWCVEKNGQSRKEREGHAIFDEAKWILLYCSWFNFDDESFSGHTESPWPHSPIWEADGGGNPSIKSTSFSCDAYHTLTSRTEFFIQSQTTMVQALWSGMPPSGLVLLQNRVSDGPQMAWKECEAQKQEACCPKCWIKEGTHQWRPTFTTEQYKQIMALLQNKNGND